ncbi:MAG: response regulator transcription factor [Actinobacteria bacterium]|nr:response regulator transcription factor [Actinomycetota bacterium]
MNAQRAILEEPEFNAWFDKSDIKARIKKAMMHGQRLRCCYCRRFQDTTNNLVWDLEHILCELHYPQFFAVAGNLAIACKQCNNAKKQADVLLPQASPAEIDMRLRLAVGTRVSSASDADAPSEVSAAGVVIDEGSFTARVHDRMLDLTYKEFELLKYLAQHPGRVFTRAQLLQEVWGYDYFGGTRTVDVHVRRLRAKLGTEHETLIGTVRNVGYRFVPEDEEAEVGAS